MTDPTTSSHESHADSKRGRHTASWVPLAYLVLALVMTWPLATRLDSHLPQGDHDLWQNYWNFWSWKVALCEEQRSPYRTSMIYRPLEEIRLGNHTHSPANILLTLPFNLLFGPAVALNVALLAGFVLAGLGTYLLAREYGAGSGSAFLGGIVFAYFPQHIEQGLEHLNLASYYAMPFFLWSLARTVRVGGKWWLACGGFFALNALLSWHNALLIFVAACAIFVFEWRRTVQTDATRSSGKILFDVILATIVALLIMSPFLWPLVRDTMDGIAVLKKRAVNKPIDPLFLLIPHTGHPLWGSALNGLYAHFRGYLSVGFMAYVGVVGLALATTGFLPGSILRGRHQGVQAPGRGRGVWLALLIFYLLLSFGETLTVARQPIMPMPFHWLKEIPLFGIVRVPNRFLVPAMLALALLAAQGAARLSLFFPETARRRVLVALGTLLILDYAWLPFPLRAIPEPAWTTKLESYPKEMVILNVPGGHNARASDDLLLQTRHHHPMVSGYSSSRIKAVDALRERFPVLREIFLRYPRTDPSKTDAPTDLPGTARALGVGLVLIHLDRTVEARLEKRDQIRQQSGGDPYAMRLHNPEKGIPRATLDRFRRELRQEFGEPTHVVDGVVEIYEVR